MASSRGVALRLLWPNKRPCSRSSAVSGVKAGAAAPTAFVAPPAAAPTPRTLAATPPLKAEPSNAAASSVETPQTARPCRAESVISQLCASRAAARAPRNSATAVVTASQMPEGEPYYPVPNVANQALYKRYEALADNEPNVTFLGRLGTYRYMNMDQVVGQALAAARRLTQGSLVRVWAAE